MLLKATAVTINPHSRKRLFIALLGASLLALTLLAAGVWYLIFNPDRSVVYQIVLLSMIGLLVSAVVVAGFGLAGILLTLLAAKTYTPLQTPMRVAINLFFPLALGLGRAFGIEKDIIRSSFVEVNNQLVKARRVALSPRELLLLAPHCLQRTECPHKITADINNCHRCGGCCINDLLNISDKFGVPVGIATGGTLARKYVKEYRPRAIVAIACERDLTSGIQDSNPIPVLGVKNQRPFGPCNNTRISVPEVEEAILNFLK